MQNPIIHYIYFHQTIGELQEEFHFSATANASKEHVYPKESSWHTLSCRKQGRYVRELFRFSPHIPSLSLSCTAHRWALVCTLHGQSCRARSKCRSLPRIGPSGLSILAATLVSSIAWLPVPVWLARISLTIALFTPPASAPVFLVAYSVYQGLGKLFDVGELGGIWVHFRNRRVASGSSPNLKRLSSQIERPGRFIEVRKFDYCNGPSKSKSSIPSEDEFELEEE